MRYLLLVLIVSVCSPCFADVVVIYNNDGIYTISEKDDTVVPTGYQKDVIKDKKLAQLQLGDDVSVYDYSNKKFSINGQRISDKNKKEQDLAVKDAERASAKASAINKLKVLGLTDSEIAAIGGN